VTGEATTAAPVRPPDPLPAPEPRPSMGPAVLGLWPVVVAFVAFVAVWKLAAMVAGLGFILPAPEVVAARFGEAWLDGTIAPHAWTTVVEVVLGFAVGGGLGLVVGYVIARSRLVERLVSPYLVAAQAIPILALAPLLALWFGPGLLAKVVVCGLIVFFPVAIATMVGIRSVDRGLLELAASLRAGRRQVLTTIEIPAALPSILGGLRVGATLAVVGAIVAEWAGPDRGLGVLVNLARGSLFDYPLMFATLVTIALLGIVAYLLVVLAERRLVGVR
jgi:ABC-type nitrate/sulfonate/bicarbonate transport system permease component